MVTNLKTNIVKVKFYNEDAQEFRGREYSYYSEDELNVGDIVTVPTFRGTGKAQVTTINIPESEVAAFKEAMKTIPTGSVEENLESETGITTTLPLSTTSKEKNPSPAIPASVLYDKEFMEAGNKPGTAVIIINPFNNPGFINLRNSLTLLKKYAEARIINNDKDVIPATDDLAIIAKCKKELTALRDQYVKPIRGYLDDVIKPFGELAQLLADAEIINKNKIKGFTIAQEAKAAEIAEVNRQAEELARKQAALSGTGEFTVDTTPIAAPVPVHKVSTQSGSTSIVNKPPTWELEDWSKVPDQYKMLDTVKIGKVVRAGGSIPGIKIIQQTGVRVTTRQA